MHVSDWYLAYAADLKYRYIGDYIEFELNDNRVNISINTWTWIVNSYNLDPATIEFNDSAKNFTARRKKFK